MMDRQALFEQFLDLLQTSPPLTEYLDGEPELSSTFDPYQMVAEWIALRHEVKQQGKLLQSSQSMLQQALDTLQTKQTQWQQQQELHQQTGVALADQKLLWRDLLTVMDSLDQACAHWQQQLETQVASLQTPAQSGSQPFWQRWVQQLAQAQTGNTVSAPASSLQDVLVSNQQGVEDILRQRQVVPMVALGQVFNPQIIYAVGRQETSLAPENTVIQEVVRGYRWGEQILREAQVIVAVKPA
jgi:molecular chaperone GrpE